MSKFQNSIESKFTYKSYFNLMFGNSCDYLTISNCSTSIASFGVDTGTKLYLLDIYSKIAKAKQTGFSKADLVTIEKYCQAIASSWVQGLSVYQNYTDSLVNMEESFMSLCAYVFFVVVAVYFFLFFIGLSKSIVENLEEKIELLTVFAEESDKKTNVKTSKAGGSKESLLG